MKYHKHIEPGEYNMFPRGSIIGAKVRIEIENGRYFFHFGFNKPLMEEIKLLDKRKYHGFDEVNPRKVWSAPITRRNNFQVRRMMRQNVYEPFDLPLVSVDFTRPLFENQKLMARHGLTRKRCIIAGEMGTGKTLAAIEIMERSNKPNWWWVGPKSALAAVQYDMRKWKCRVTPQFMTYEAMTKLVNSGTATAPDGIVLDESSKVKTHNSKRTLAAFAVANDVIVKDGYLILMSGTPAPKTPTDWWSQTEICCPGFLIEPDPNSMKYTMAYITEQEGPAGSKFPKLIGWKDTDKRCDVCGEEEGHMFHLCHEDENEVKKAIIASPDDVLLRAKLQRIKNTKIMSDGMHAFVPGKNEVARLYNRLKGMSLVVFKKDCLDLPDKFYREVVCPVPKDMQEAAKFLVGIERRGASALMKLRQLSDGFLYKEREIDRSVCSACEGKKTVDHYWSEELFSVVPADTPGAELKKDQPCVACDGRGYIPVMEDYTEELPSSPKEKAMADLMDEYEDIGRMVVFAAFTASIDKLTTLAVDKGWHYVRVDGRGWSTTIEDVKEPSDMIALFQEPSRQDSPDRMIFIMHPESGGMGLTLTASPCCIFYSNDFKAENRMQAEDRIHRIGMDASRGATIIDLICLETDRLIVDNLKKKKDLQAISMGDLSSCLDKERED